MKKSGRLGWLVSAFVLLTFCGGCSFLPRFNKKLSGDRAFIRYSPIDTNSNQLRLAVKDNIDLKGVVTTTGSEFFLKTHKPANADAPCLEIARQRGVKIVGKTNMTEFAVAPSGHQRLFRHASESARPGFDSRRILIGKCGGAGQRRSGCRFRNGHGRIDPCAGCVLRNRWSKND